MVDPASKRRIWLIGGTKESADLAVAIASAALACTITVTTDAARSLYPNSPLLHIWVGRLDASDLKIFLQQHNIVAVLDASHPYAVEISKGAIAACNQFNLPYLRYERPSLEWGSGGVGEGGMSLITDDQLPITVFLDSFETLVAGNYLEGQRVLLTIGYKVLPLFRAWQEKATLFARILPSLVSLEAALAAGFTADRIIALRPPISAELEKALWYQWEISLVVTKASGATGGEDIKRMLAAELGVNLVIIERPIVHYPRQTSDLSTALKFCQQFSD